MLFWLYSRRLSPFPYDVLAQILTFFYRELSTQRSRTTGGSLDVSGENCARLKVSKNLPRVKNI